LRRYAKANDIAVQLTELEKRAKAKLAQMGQALDVAPGTFPEPEQEPEPVDQDKEDEDDEEITPVERTGKEKRLGYYFEVKEKERTCHLTDEGVRKAEELAGVESFYTAGNMEWPHLIDNALKAHHLYHKDKQYVVMRHPETNDMS